MITDAAAAGVVGGSIEDSTGDKSKPIYDFNLAVERVQAAVEAARALPFPFTFTARAENLLHGSPDLDDIIRRLQAFEKAGADVLYAPGLSSLDDVRTVVKCVSKPVNVVMGWIAKGTTVQDLEALGVRRISIGGALSRVAMGAFMKAARDLKENGSFAWMADAMPTKQLKDVFRG
jgi:2-methylisocitrate lyase-like PEP mutase family enzyme